MSASPEEREDAAKGDLFGEELTDMFDLPSAGGDGSEERSAFDDDHFQDDCVEDDHNHDHDHNREDHHISEMLEEEVEQDASQPAEQTVLVNRYKQLVQEEQDIASDSGFTDAIPRRVGSPVDSSLSIPDDSPSIQVCPV